VERGNYSGERAGDTVWGPLAFYMRKKNLKSLASAVPEITESHTDKTTEITTGFHIASFA